MTQPIAHSDLKNLQKLLYGIGAFIAVLLVIGLALPRYGRFVVSTGIDAPPATVFALVNDMRRSLLWSPVSDADPNARVVVSGPARGAGSSLTWDGAIAGSGTQTIVESRPYEYVETLINAGEAAETRTWFEISGDAAGSRVEWSFEHDYGFNVIGRYAGLVVTPVLRREHERQLQELKALAESLPRADFSDLEIERVRVEAEDIAYVRTTAPPQPDRMSAALGESYFQVLRFMDRHGLHAAGAPLSIARAFRGAELSFDAGIPVRGVTAATPRDDAPVRIGRSYGGDAIRVRHIGPYRGLAATHRKIAAYLAALGIERAGDAWESYVSDPTEVDEAVLVTYVYYPVRDR